MPLTLITPARIAHARVARSGVLIRAGRDEQRAAVNLCDLGGAERSSVNHDLVDLAGEAFGDVRVTRAVAVAAKDDGRRVRHESAGHGLARHLLAVDVQ